MPPILSKPSSAAPTALIYITIGALLTVWSGLWFFYLRENPPAHHVVNYLDLGLLLTGIVFLIIGFGLGPMARLARQAELPPPGVTDAAVQRAGADSENVQSMPVQNL